MKKDPFAKHLKILLAMKKRNRNRPDLYKVVKELDARLKRIEKTLSKK